MNLPGRLRGTTLGDLLGALHRDRATGVLELTEELGATAGRSHRIHFDAGLVRAVESAFDVSRLGEILRQEGFLADSALRRLSMRLLERRDKRVGELLVEERLATPELVSAALRHQLRIQLNAVFQLRDALVRFHIARPLLSRAQPPLSPREFLHGRPRRRAEQAAPRGAPRAQPRQASARSRALQVLGLPGSAGRADVQRAFRRLAAAVHPDRHPRASEAELQELLQRFQELSAAYHTLVA